MTVYLLDDSIISYIKHDCLLILLDVSIISYIKHDCLFIRRFYRIIYKT